LRVMIRYEPSHVRHREVRRDSQEGAHCCGSLVGTSEQCETCGDDTMSDHISRHFAQCLPSESHCLVVLASHHMRDTQPGKIVTDARVGGVEANCTSEVFGGRARIPGVEANPAAQPKSLLGVDIENERTVECCEPRLDVMGQIG